jgi:hypothetical protein
MPEVDAMTDTEPRAMVLRDAEGSYYVFPMDLVERARVPAEREADLEAAIGRGSGEVSGYAMRSAVGGGIVTLDGSYLVDEEVDVWPVVESRGAGLLSAMRMITGSRF